MPCSGTRKCLHFHHFFNPNPRSKGRQQFCSDSECRKVSKKASQKKWLQKPQNQHYFCGPENVLRVQLWRDKNPSYSKKLVSASGITQPLQDPLIMQGTEKNGGIEVLKHDALQDLLMAQPSVLIGLITHLTGSTLQDDIVRTGQKLRELGEDFLSQPHSKLGENHVISSLAQSQTIAPNPLSI